MIIRSVIHRSLSEKIANRGGCDRVHRGARNDCEVLRELPLIVCYGLTSIGGVSKVSQYSAVQSTPSGNQGVSPLDRRSVEGVSSREGAGEDTPRVVTSGNVGAFVASIKNADDDTGWPISRSFRFTNHCRPQNERHKRTNQWKPMKHRLLSDWMGKLRGWEICPRPEGYIVKFG